MRSAPCRHRLGQRRALSGGDAACSGELGVARLGLEEQRLAAAARIAIRQVEQERVGRARACATPPRAHHRVSRSVALSAPKAHVDRGGAV